VFQLRWTEPDVCGLASGVWRLASGVWRLDRKEPRDRTAWPRPRGRSAWKDLLM
jgi:hypothetical protein